MAKPLKQLPHDVRHNLTVIGNSAFRAFTDAVADEAKANATQGRPYLHRRTGRLVSSVKKSPYYQWTPGGVGRQTVYSDAPYARIHERGGVIKPKRKPFLVFQVAGRWIRAKMVRIPARRWMSGAVRKLKPQWAKFVHEAKRRVLG